jgi:membrane associated rhomboid family serine protease
MIPIRDENSNRIFPLMTLVLIIANVLIFVYQLLLSHEALNAFVYRYAAVPNLIIHGQSLYTPFTSMFLHGGFLHLAGNILYLWIFGDNVEALCGHFRFLFFYILCGLVAFFGHFIFSPFSTIPMLGASGAISGILGAYFLRFPRARVTVLIPLFFFIWPTFQIPAVMVLGLWFIYQIFSGLSLPSSSGGVAWFAHVGGFLAGLLLIRLFERRRNSNNFGF